MLLSFLGFLGFLFQSFFGNVNHLLKSSRVRRGQFSQYLPIDLYAGSLKPFYEPAIGDTRRASRRINTNLPEATEIALAIPAVPVGVLPAVIQRILGISV